MIAAVTRPTMIRIAPPMPASVSEKPYGLRIWVIRDDTLLKNPTYTANGIRMSQNSSVPSSCRVAGMSGVRGIADEALGGVGGSAGRKKDGMDATLDYEIAVSIGIHIWCACGLGANHNDGYVQDHIRDV